MKIADVNFPTCTQFENYFEPTEKKLGRRKIFTYKKCAQNLPKLIKVLYTVTIHINVIHEGIKLEHILRSK